MKFAWVILAAVVLLAAGVGAVSDHALSAHAAPPAPSPVTVTATVTATVTQQVVRTAPVVVPSAVFVTVTPAPTQPAMTEYEARAYCTQIAASIWPDVQNSDPTLQQIGEAYAQSQRNATLTKCMADRGF